MSIDPWNDRDEIFALTFYRSESCGSERILSEFLEFRLNLEIGSKSEPKMSKIQRFESWEFPRFQTVPKSGGLSESWGLPIIVSRELISRVIITRDPTITTLVLQRCDLSFQVG